MSHLVQLFLPLQDNDGQSFPASHFSRVRDELTQQFNGMTAYTRAPAEGRWQSGDDRTVRDDIVVYEVMTDELDRAWWNQYRASLEKLFAQEHLLIRAQIVEVL
jgi:hypothetical protein